MAPPEARRPTELDAVAIDQVGAVPEPSGEAGGQRPGGSVHVELAVLTVLPVLPRQVEQSPISWIAPRGP